MISLPQPLAHLVGKFQLDGKEYAIDRFNIGFNQSIDFRGRPSHETRGGQLSITIGQAADNTLYDWARKSTLLKSGQVEFQTESGQTVIRILFNDAYCVRLEREVDNRRGTSTTFVIAPSHIKMNDSEHVNFWPK